jgi:hypothetical protein
LIAERTAYHDRRRRRSTNAARRLGNSGEWLFIATWAGVLAKLVLLIAGGDEAAVALGWMCAVLPAAAAARWQSFHKAGSAGMRRRPATPASVFRGDGCPLADMEGHMNSQKDPMGVRLATGAFSQ